LQTALDHADQVQAKIEKKVDARLLEELPQLGKYLNTAATLGALMPILGLLGTVTGMIATFKVIALQGTGDAQALADGISEALITTQSGLVAAVPIILGHNFLTNRYHKIVAVVKECVVKVLDYIEEHKNK
jgi:biopolymer transport protein ExbB